MTKPGRCINFAISEQYPPGSTYKLVTGAGALQDDMITPRPVDTEPYLRSAGTSTAIGTSTGFGPLNIFDGFAHSSDTFFYQLAGMLGIDRLGYWATSGASASRPASTCPARRAASCPPTIGSRASSVSPSIPGETYQAGIGQGYDAVTPLQLIDAYSALANGGTLYRPQIVRRVLAPDGSVVQRLHSPTSSASSPYRPAGAPGDARRGTRVSASRHTYNLVDLPIVHRRQIRHGRIRHPRQPGPAALPLVVRGLHAQVQRRPRTRAT